MAIGITDVSNALQKVIMPYIRDNFPKQTILLDQVKRNTGVSFMNDNFYASVRSGRHGGITNLASDTAKLITGKATIGQATLPVKILTGTFDISDLTMKATKTSKGAVENMLTWQAESLSSDFARSVNRQYFGDGSGIIAQVSSSANGSVVPVKLPNASLDDGAGTASDRYGAINGDITPTKYLAVGQIVGVGTAAAAKGTIAAISHGVGTANGSITFNTAQVQHAANDAIGFVDGSLGGFGTADIFGLSMALSDSTADYASLARTTTGWTPQVGTASEALTLSAIEDKYLAAKEYSAMGDRYAIFMNKTLYKKYGDLLTAQRRNVNETDLLGGWTGLEFAAGAGKVGVFLDYDTPDGDVFIVNLDTLTVCEVGAMDWLESSSPGSMLRTVDYLTYQSTMAWYTNLLCLCPAANGRLVQKTA
jgi:hypothetical protein